MTDVGKISLGVEIDASDLSARLGEAVRRAIGPALAEIQRELEKTQREYDKTARTSEKASTVQTAGAKEVANAVQQVGQEQEKTAAKTKAAGAVTTRQINAITRALDKQTAAWTANTAAQAANAAVPGGGGGGGGGSGGGGGGGSGGGRRRVDQHRGGFMQGGRGRFGFLTSPVGLNLIAGGIGSFPAAATAVTNLTGAVQALGQAGLALPGIYGAAGSSIGVAVAGFHGMKDAVKALNDAAKSGDPKDLEKATEAMKDMDPAAQAVAKTVSSLTRGPLLDLQKQIQGRMFRDWAGDIQATADRAIPRLSGSIGGIADAWNGTLRQLTGSLGSDRNLGLIDRLLGNTAEGQKRMNAAIDPLVHAALTLVGAGSDVLPRLADGLTAGAKRLDDFLTKADQDGRLSKWINDGIAAAHNLAETFLNIGKIITGLTGAAGGDGGFLAWLNKVTGQLQTFINSPEGQNSLRKFFDDGREQMKQWLPIIENLGKLLLQVYEASHAWAGILLPFLQVATDLLVKMPGLTQGLLLGFLAFRTISPFVGLLGQLDKLNSKLGDANTKAGGLKGKFSLGGLGATGAVLGLGGAISNAGARSEQDISGGSILATIGGGALLGAEVAGPVGAAFGTLAGAAVSLTEVFLAQSRRLDDDNKKWQTFLDNRPPALPAITPNSQILPGPAVQPPPGISSPNPTPGPTTVRGLLLGPEAGVGMGNGGDIRNLDAINGALAQIGDKAAAANANVDLLKNGIETLPTGQVVLKDATPDAIQHVKDLGYAVTTLPTGQVQINVQYMLDGQPISHDQLVAPIRAPAIPGDTYRGPGRAAGGAIYGGVPGKDSVLSWLMPGEHVFDVGDVAAMGGQANVYNFRRALHFADGGAVPGGLDPAIGLPGPETELDVLKQIRDLLGGKGGTASNPIAATAANTATTATAAKTVGQVGQEIGPFGTPLKKKDRAYDAAKGALSALGFDPETIIGSDPMAQPVTTATAGGAGTVPGAAPGASAVDFTTIAASLSKFAISGNLADVAGLGLNANSPVVTAITSARNKKQGMSDQDISSLVNQIVGGGGYTGTLDASNTSIIKSLTSFHDQLVKKGAVPGAAPGIAPGIGLGAVGGDQASIARAIFGAVTGQGYSSQAGLTAVAAGLLESGLSPAARNSGHNSLFQTSSDKGVPDDPAAQIQWLLSEMAAQGGPVAANADPLNFFADKIERGGYAGSRYQQFLAQAQALVGQSGAPMIAAAPAQSSGWFPGGGGRVQGSKQGLQPAAANLFDVIAQQFPQIQNIGGVRADALPYHPSGRALDIMIPGAGGLNDPTPPDAKALGDSIYQFLMQNASQLGIDTSGTLWQQKDHFNHIHAQLLDGVQQFTNAGLTAAPGMGGLGGAAGGAGTPVFVTNWPGGQGQLPGFAKDMIGAGMDAAGQAGANVAGDIGGAVTSAFAVPADQRQPNVDFATLRDQQNPMALAAALGFNVQDFSRFGGAGAQGVDQTGGGFDATGRLFSDTAALIDRTFTSLNAQLEAMKQQLTDVVQQVADKLNQDAVEPIIKAGVQSALADLKDSVLNGLGTAIGQAAAPPIADAVKSAVASLPIDSNGNAAQGVGGGAASVVSGLVPGMASGGAVSGGTPGRDSVPAWLMPGEHVLTTKEVARMGGQAGVERFRTAVMNGGVRKFATGGGVNVNDVVGAEFFGVSEVPIISTIVNLLIRVLLKVIGVDIEARDTLQEMSNDFRQFRGDAFKSFDAAGRLMNDTSGLIERSSTSEQAAADERIRILKIVIQAIIKYLIEKVIVPIAKAVANSAIQAGATAASGAITGAGGGPAGGIVGSIISSAGQAGVDIAAEVGTDFALAMSQTLIDMVAEGLQSQFPDLVTGLLGGSGLASLFDPLGGGLGNILGSILGIFTGLIGGGVFGGASTLIPGLPFDDGGMASGVGYLPKATMSDELVLSPGETDLFSRFVSALERGGFGKGGNTTSVHAPITVIGGGRETATQVENRLLKLMP